MLAGGCQSAFHHSGVEDGCWLVEGRLKVGRPFIIQESKTDAGRPALICAAEETQIAKTCSTGGSAQSSVIAVCQPPEW